MWKKIFIGLVTVIAVLAVIVAMQPSEYRIERSATISAPPSAVFPHVNDFHAWQDWSPWAKLDPNCKYTIEGPTSGTGAIYKWAGNDQVGEGAMKITESVPNELIKIDLEFLKPMPGICLTEFHFKTEGSQTNVTWTMTGRNNFVGKAFCLVMNMDKMVGGDFEKGLANMKAIIEASKEPKKPE